MAVKFPQTPLLIKLTPVTVNTGVGVKLAVGVGDAVGVAVGVREGVKVGVGDGATPCRMM